MKPANVEKRRRIRSKILCRHFRYFVRSTMNTREPPRTFPFPSMKQDTCLGQALLKLKQKECVLRFLEILVTPQLLCFGFPRQYLIQIMSLWNPPTATVFMKTVAAVEKSWKTWWKIPYGAAGRCLSLLLRLSARKKFYMNCTILWKPARFRVSPFFSTVPSPFGPLISFGSLSITSTKRPLRTRFAETNFLNFQTSVFVERLRNQNILMTFCRPKLLSPVPA